MTSDVADMSNPVTRGELRDELAQLEHRIERKFDDKLDRLERKFDTNLGLWGEALAAQIRELAAQTRELAAQTRELAAQLPAQIRESEKRLLNELARHTQAGFEAMTREISVVDEKYNDLPARVARLEVEVDARK
jgi:outer membrane murein-binding lipoprotein Lpp